MKRYASSDHVEFLIIIITIITTMLASSSSTIRRQQRSAEFARQSQMNEPEKYAIDHTFAAQRGDDRRAR
jgi:hypothetical protein